MSEQTKVTHTPGPWRVKWTAGGRCDGIAPNYHNHAGEDCYEFDREDYETCPYTDEIVTTDGGCYGPQPADACLIATAPDMLALLKRLRGWDMLDACPDGPYWKSELDRVIMKAEPD